MVLISLNSINQLSTRRGMDSALRGSSQFPFSTTSPESRGIGVSTEPVLSIQKSPWTSIIQGFFALSANHNECLRLGQKIGHLHQRRGHLIFAGR
jgi:hypothetical protein